MYIVFQPGWIQDLGTGFVRESWGWKSPPIGVQQRSPCRRSGGQVTQKLVIFCKLCYNDVVWKKAKQYLLT